MKFSLVVSTINRTNEIIPFLDSLINQRYKDFEVIVVDQNLDDRLGVVLASYQNKFEMRTYRSDKGLSRGRNEGMKHITGDVVAFPDDDCVYPMNLLDAVRSCFEKDPDVDVISGKTVDSLGRTSVGVFDGSSKKLTPADVWKNHNSISLFIRRKVVDTVGGFDEMMGIGTYYASSEETDYVIRILKEEFVIQYTPSVLVQHEQVEHSTKSSQKSRALSYGRGAGRLIRKHGKFFSVYDYFKVLFGPIFRMIKPLTLNNTILQIYSLAGRWQGFIK